MRLTENPEARRPTTDGDDEGEHARPLRWRHLRQLVRVRQALIDAQVLGASATRLLEKTSCGIIQLR